MVLERFNADGTINQNWMAKEISVREGKKEEVDIAQIKEVMKYVFQILAEFNIEDVQELLLEYE